MSHVVLCGATDGIGLALARLYAARGCHVGILGRDPAKLERVAEELRGIGAGQAGPTSESGRGLPVGRGTPREAGGTVSTAVCDVRDQAGAEASFAAVLHALGRMDLFVYCAGVMHPGEGPHSDAAADRETMDVNAVGAVHLLGLAANYFRLAQRGHLAAIGSIAGDRGRKGNPAYTASKAALHAYLEALRNRLHPFGVRVTTIKPGFVRTRMLAGRADGAGLGGDGIAAPSAHTAAGAPGGDWPAGSITAEEAARLIARGLDRGREVFYVPWWWGLVAFVLRHTPRFVFKRMGPP